MGLMLLSEYFFFYFGHEDVSKGYDLGCRF